MSLLEIRDLHAGYARKRAWTGTRQAPVRALQGVSLTLERGSIHGLAGESGSGKSTLARALVQLVRDARGSVMLDGQELFAAQSKVSPAISRDARRRIQLIFQDPGASLSPRRTIAQSLREPAQHFDLPHGDADLIAALEAVGLDGTALARRPRAFSSGQRQRIAIARALICKPDVLIADEALAALDVSVQAQVLALLHELCRERDLGILLISHDLAVLRENAGMLSVMYRGRLVEQGPAERVFRQPAHPYTRQLLANVPNGQPPLASDTGLAIHSADPGCVFRHRCPLAFDRCAEQQPERRALPQDADHHLECHLDPPPPQ